MHSYSFLISKHHWEACVFQNTTLLSARWPGQTIQHGKCWHLAPNADAGTGVGLRFSAFSWPAIEQKERHCKSHGHSLRHNRRAFKFLTTFSCLDSSIAVWPPVSFNEGISQASKMLEARAWKEKENDRRGSKAGRPAYKDPSYRKDSKRTEHT